MKQDSNVYSTLDFSLALLIANIYQDETVNSLFRVCLYNSVSSGIKSMLPVAQCFFYLKHKSNFEIL